MLELLAVGVHQVQGGLDGVGHVHHVELRALLQEAGVLALLDGLVEDLDRVIGGAPARQSHVGDNARITHAAGIDAEPLVIVVAEQLAGHLGDAVHGVRPLDGVLRRAVLRRREPEGADRTGHEHRALVLAGHLQNVVQAVDVHVPGQLADWPRQRPTAGPPDGRSCRSGTSSPRLRPPLMSVQSTTSKGPESRNSGLGFVLRPPATTLSAPCFLRKANVNSEPIWPTTDRNHATRDWVLFPAAGHHVVGSMSACAMPASIPSRSGPRPCHQHSLHFNLPSEGTSAGLPHGAEIRWGSFDPPPGTSKPDFLAQMPAEFNGRPGPADFGAGRAELAAEDAARKSTPPSFGYQLSATGVVVRRTRDLGPSYGGRGAFHAPDALIGRVRETHRRPGIRPMAVVRFTHPTD